MNNNPEQKPIHFKYKCRLCGAIFKNKISTSSYPDALIGLLNISLDREPFTIKNIPLMNKDLHQCSVNQIGIADLQGAEYEK